MKEVPTRTWKCVVASCIELH